MICYNSLRTLVLSPCLCVGLPLSLHLPCRYQSDLSELWFYLFCHFPTEECQWPSVHCQTRFKIQTSYHAPSFLICAPREPQEIWGSSSVIEMPASHFFSVDSLFLAQLQSGLGCANSPVLCPPRVSLCDRTESPCH